MPRTPNEFGLGGDYLPELSRSRGSSFRGSCSRGPPPRPPSNPCFQTNTVPTSNALPNERTTSNNSSTTTRSMRNLHMNHAERQRSNISANNNINQIDRHVDVTFEHKVTRQRSERNLSVSAGSLSSVKIVRSRSVTTLSRASTESIKKGCRKALVLEDITTTVRHESVASQSISPDMIAAPITSTHTRSHEQHQQYLSHEDSLGQIRDSLGRIS